MSDIRDEWRLQDMERKLNSMESRLYELDEVRNLRQQLSNQGLDIDRVTQENSNLRYEFQNLQEELRRHVEEHHNEEA